MRSPPRLNRRPLILPKNFHHRGTRGTLILWWNENPSTTKVKLYGTFTVTVAVVRPNWFVEYRV